MPEKFSIDQEAVRLLAALLNESGLTEIEFQQGQSRIRVAKEVHTVLSNIPPMPVVSSGLSAAVETSVLSPVSSPEESVSSPMVGIVYVAPEPGAPPYVRVGDEIKEGQILFIIEAMKIMNPIRAIRSGIVTKVCVTDASPVEFGDTLLLLS